VLRCMYRFVVTTHNNDEQYRIENRDQERKKDIDLT
jgi:hypothetical protein